MKTAVLFLVLLVAMLEDSAVAEIQSKIIRNAYRLATHNQKGYVSTDLAIEALKFVQRILKETPESLIEKIDVNKNDRIEEDEFEKVARIVLGDGDDETLKKEIKNLLRNFEEDGHVDVLKIVYLIDIDDDFTKENQEAIFKEIDTDKSGKTSADEILDFLSRD